MVTKTQSGYSLKLVGPGVSFDRPISEEVANRIINLVMTGGTNPAALGASGGALPATLTQPQGQFAQPQPLAAGMTIKQFIAQKRPENLYQRVACLAYYLSHVLDTPRFKTKDISKANTDAWPAPGSEDTRFGVTMESEVGHGAAEVYAGVQA